MKNISQIQVIHNLNQYLDWHNLPIRMDKSGICQGLASLRAKYILEGREAYFQQMLERIASIDPKTTRNSQINLGLSSDSETDFSSALNAFAVEVVLSFLPSKFDRDKTQRESIDYLQIEGKKLKSSFGLGLIARDASWKEIIEKIDLRENEAMLITSSGHAISVNKKDGRYIVYDPNYPGGLKSFSNEKKLIQEFHKIFSLSKGQLGMNIEVIRHPNAEERHFPDGKQLYEQYLDPSQTTLFDKYVENNLLFAIKQNDMPAVRVLFSKGFQDPFPITSACLAIAANSLEVIDFLLEKIPETEEQGLRRLFAVTMGAGRFKVFDKLLENPKLKKVFDQVAKEVNFSSFLQVLAKGGSVEFFQKIKIMLNKTDEEVVDALLEVEPFTKKDVVQAAIENGSFDCTKWMITQLEKKDGALDEERLLRYLLISIKTNQPNMVDFFVSVIKNKIPNQGKNIFESITMGTELVEKTDISILRTLRDSGTKFSGITKNIIEYKETFSAGFLLPIGIMLDKFTDYIKHVIFKKDEMISSVENLKTRLIETRSSLTAKELDEPVMDNPRTK